MKILVGNNGFGNPGGSETYAYALIEELVRRGHEVHAVAKIGPGMVSDRLRRLGVPVYFDKMEGKYDLLLLSHSTSIERVTDVSGFRIQTCHGIYPLVEQPVKGMDAYVSISKEVKNHLSKKGFTSTVIYNGIDCGRFYPIVPIHGRLRNVLSLAHSNTANQIISRACDIIGCDLMIRNKYKAPVWEMEKLINWADMVIGLGRGIYEAMACSRNAVIFDYRSYMGETPLGDGFCTSSNVSKFLKNNCSGRYSRLGFDAESLAEEMLNYNSEEGQKLRLFVLEKLDIEKQVDKYLALIR